MFAAKNNKPTVHEKIETIIGPGTSVTGNINATGMVRIDGRLTGELHTEGNIIIGDSGQVYGIVKGRDITIAGLLEGNADAAGCLHIVATGRLYGDIDTDSLVVEEGAQYKGNCQMKSDKKGADQPQ